MDCNHTLAFVSESASVTYDDLGVRIQQWIVALNNAHILPNEIVAIEGDYSLGSISLLFALLERGNSIVPLSLGNVGGNQFELSTADVSVKIVFQEKDEYQIVYLNQKRRNPLLTELDKKNHQAIILFSSGSTGEKKAIALSAQVFQEKFRGEKKPLVTMGFLLFDHIGGINTLFHVLGKGGTFVTVKNRRPDKICQMIEQYRVELLPTTPSFLNILLMSKAYEEYDLSSLKIVTYGTEAMPESTIHALNRVLPKLKFKQTYGLSEIGIVPTQSESSSSLWFQIKDNIPYKIVDNILHIKNNVPILGYLNAEAPLDSEGYFITGDQVETKTENGELFIKIVGRASEIINVGGEKVYPAEVESVLLEMPPILDVSVYGKKNAVMGQVVAAKINVHHEATDFSIEKVRAFCQEKLASYKIPMLIDVVSYPLYGARQKKIKEKA